MKNSLSRRLAFIHPTSLLHLCDSIVALSLTVHMRGPTQGKPPQCVYISKYMSAGHRKFRTSFILVTYGSAVSNTVTLMPSTMPMIKRPAQEQKV